MALFSDFKNYDFPRSQFHKHKLIILNPNENDFWLSVLPFISDSTDNQKLRMKVVSDSPTTENKTKENAACQLRARGKSVIRLGVKRSRSDFQW